MGVHVGQAHCAPSRPSRPEQTGEDDAAVTSEKHREAALLERRCDVLAEQRAVIRDLDLVPAPEPLLAPPAIGDWELLWSSEAPAYGGGGTAPANADGRWHVLGESALVLGAPGHSR